jgi:excisionase family DNA binding protein
MIPASASPPKEFAISDVAEYFGVSERRIRDLLARGELRGRREGKRKWVIDMDAVIEFAERAPHRKGRRLSNEAQWAILCLLDCRDLDWIDPVLKSRTIHRITTWTAEQLAEAVATRGPKPSGVKFPLMRMQSSWLDEATSFSDRKRERALARGRTVLAQWPAHYRAHYWREHGMPVGAAQDAPDIPRTRASVKRSAGLPLPPVESKDSIRRRPAMSMTAISAAEQAERERIIAAAIHSGEMEGLHVTEATKADTDKYIAGELDLDELAAKVRARYGIA